MRSARLTGLAPATLYRCRLDGDAAVPASARFRFRTAPGDGTPFRFAVVGDTGDKSAAAAANARRIRAGRPAFVLHLGDFAYVRYDALGFERRFFRPYRRLLRHVPFYPTPGNHDLTSRSAFARVFAPLDGGGHRYAFDWGAATFVSVSSVSLARDAATAAWLRDTLAAVPPERWRILFLHEPPFSPGRKVVTRGLRRTLAGILAAERVDLILAGHDHLYARATPVCTGPPGAGTLQIISGGGGASLDRARTHPNFPVVISVTHHLRVRVTPEAIEVRAVDLDRRQRDRVRLRRGAPVACRADGWPRPREKDR